jgi:phosphatidylglycerol:prolipoprotein diacylglycerol transferase
MRAYRYDLGPVRFLFTSSLHALASIGGAKVYSLVEHGDLRASTLGGLMNPVVWHNGYRAPGGILAAIAAFPVVRRLLGKDVSLPTLADIVTPSIGPALVVVRIGCFLTGCCFGTTTDVRWAVRFPPDSRAYQEHLQLGLIAPGAPYSLPVHPLQLYLLLLSAVVTGVVIGLERRRHFAPGQIALLFLALHEAGKFLLEGLRAPENGFASPYLQPISLGLAAFGFFGYLVSEWRSRTALQTAHVS